MAILQSTDALEERIGNKYSLVIVSAKRARQLKDGHPPLVQDTSPNPLSVALSEVAAGKLESIAPPEEEIVPAPREMISSLVAGTDFDLDEDVDLEETDAMDDLAALLVGDEDDEEDEAEEAAPVADDAEDDSDAADDSEDADEADDADETDDAGDAGGTEEEDEEKEDEVKE
jgi:DNA-directed RNA polymerase omega subunit